MRPNFMDDLIPFGFKSRSVLVPQPAIVQGGEYHHGLSIFAVPAAATFQAMSGRLAFGFDWSGSILPMPCEKRFIADHVATLCAYCIRPSIVRTR